MEKILIDNVEIPEGVHADVKGTHVKINGSGKENTRNFISKFIKITLNDKYFEVWSNSEKRNAKAEGYAIGSHLKNMIRGLNADFVYKMEIVYSHFPMTVAVKGKIVEINNLAGAKHPRKAKISGRTKVEIKGKDVVVSGPNIEEVGQTAANIEQATKIRGKDIRVYQDGVYITEKPAKA
ncbi:MAG: 50S ribosomal protein L6 [Candidatus Diapherotrites archaeon CG11_big_fil_rev_8_21_14_0_20_37_9]|nr:MAG: 50S ribosomal protein L6 [Candidatus Diapherotrites archaeon CG11_big_fil_rev_8_21_14_0_20_37_9]